MGGLSIWHWLVVLVIVLVLFGRGRVADIMGEFGKGLKSFKQGMSEDEAKPGAAPTVHSLEGPHHDAKPAGEAAKDPHPGAEHRN
jgi:sec-independent protein translocase protein TatA